MESNLTSKTPTITHHTPIVYGYKIQWVSITVVHAHACTCMHVRALTRMHTHTTHTHSLTQVKHFLPVLHLVLAGKEESHWSVGPSSHEDLLHLWLCTPAPGKQQQRRLNLLTPDRIQWFRLAYNHLWRQTKKMQQFKQEHTCLCKGKQKGFNGSTDTTDTEKKNKHN